jgi:RimJ/RimL family protein N-acetyltransferase
MEGRLRDEVWYDGRWRDCLVYSMLKGEWEEKYGGGKAVEGT